MAVYTAGFDYDIFVSYAHVDNVKLGEEEAARGWVHNLVNDLRTLLPQKLGRPEWGNIWIDHRRLIGNEPLTPDIQQAVSRSATLVVILSEGYLQSDWCRQERELFLQMAQRSGSVAGRVFVVQLTAIERSRWPAPFADLLGYKFFLMDDQTGRPRTLKLNADDPKDRCYSQRIDDLSLDLADRLKAMRAETVPPATVIATAATPANDGIPIFLAETTPDLEDWRDDIKRQLEQAGLRVLPATYYLRSPADFTAAMQKDLQECLLFVQLLGPYMNYKAADLPKGYEGLQLDLAKEANKTIMRWRDPALNMASSKNPELQSDDIMVMAFGDFKRDVEKRARSLATKQKLGSQQKPDRIPGDAFALVNAVQIDQSVADDICQVLKDHNIGYDRIFDEETPLTDLVKEAIDIYNALVFVYGQCDPGWVQKQLRTCRTIVMSKKDKAPVCALYIGPPPDKKCLPIMVPRFHYFKDYHEEAFNRFITDVQTKVEAVASNE
jgi:hypothetical protein